MYVYSLLYIVISLILDTIIIPCIIHQCMYSLCISLVVLHNAVVHPPRPSDERPPVMYGQFCLVPRVSAHRRYYCICFPIFFSNWTLDLPTHFQSLFGFWEFFFTWPLSKALVFVGRFAWGLHVIGGRPHIMNIFIYV